MNYSFYKSDLDPDSEEEMTQALSRTIEEVFDMQEGVFINSSDFLAHWRSSVWGHAVNP